VQNELVLLGIGFLAGTTGSMLGIGGGFIIVPLLVLISGLEMHLAVATSLVSIVMTSIASASVYSNEGLIDFKLGLLLSIFTTIGAIIGAYLAIHISENALKVIFGVVLTYASLRMLKGKFHKKEEGKRRFYLGPPLSFLAGMASGMLGIGGGTLKVPLMVLALKVPTKIAIATSAFMIGITASSGALVYWSLNMLDPHLVAPIALGIFLGSKLGTRIGLKAGEDILRRVFGALLLFFALRMLLRGLGVNI